MPTKMLKLSADLSLPIDAATQTFGFIGRKGSGKTYGSGKLTELLIEAGVQTLVLDTVGNWYGLRLAADGTGDGFDVPVLGGLRGDIPLNAAAGELVADIAVDTGRSLVIDVSQFSLADRKRFATAFAIKLWQRKKAELDPTPLFIVVEEAQLIIPQFVGKDDARMVGIWEEIVRLGRNYGIGVALISQRPQSVNKEALTQVECLVVFQVNGVPERKALRDWITAKGLDVDLVAELPGLPVGTAYVWSPQWLDYLGKVKIAPKKTLDASATPKVGEKRIRREPKPLDLAALEERMGALIEEKRENDPRELKKRISDLERRLKSATPVATVETKIERVEVPVIGEAELKALRDGARLAQEAASALSTAAERIAAALSGAQRMVGHRSTEERAIPTPTRSNRELGRNVITTNLPTRTEGVSGPQQRILDALASFEALGIRDAARSNVAVFSDASSQSSAFTNNLGTLRTAGLIDYPSPGRVALTDAGRAVASPTTPITSVDQLHSAWFSKLSGPQARILGALIDRYPRALDREELAQRSSASATSSAYTNNLGALRSLGLIDYPARGEVAATALLFPDGVPA
jgi:uncharacterized protein